MTQISTHTQKITLHLITGRLSLHPQQFQVLINSLFRVLFNFPLRYLFAIGLPHVFSFGRRLPPIFGLHSQADLLSENISYAPALQCQTGISPSMSPLFRRTYTGASAESISIGHISRTEAQDSA